ncbi:MAG: rane protein [Rhodospirillales bacterium]|jgi:hypothetical protein|nr:rane protein [Rhodospirillales bacterium]
MRNVLLSSAIGASLLLIAGAAAAQNIRGTIATVDGDTLAIDERGGDKVSVVVPAAMPVTAIVPAKLTDIKPGSIIGSAAMPQPDGSFKALEVQIFPESLRSVRQGQFPYDLKPQSAMINAGVGDVVGTADRTVTMKLQDKEIKLLVPADAPIITYEPGDHAMLKPGAHVIVATTKDDQGATKVQRIAVGKDGLVPPM